jgi:hypothetical protein
MEDLDYKAMQDAVSGRLATETLRFLMLARARRISPTAADVERILWLKSLLLRSLGGARRVSMEPEALAPGLHQARGAVDEELESFAALRRFSNTESPSAHATWVQDGVKALDKLVDQGWDALDPAADVELIESSLLPLLRWMSGANDRGTRDRTGSMPLIGA